MFHRRLDHCWPLHQLHIHRSVCLMMALTLGVAGWSNRSDAADASGRWVGSWSSSESGHQGALRARIRQVDHDSYRALFAGRFAVVIPFVYPAKLDRVTGTHNQYRSVTRLPMLGEYRMTATVTATQFNATFRGKKDLGMFRMTRR